MILSSSNAKCFLCYRSCGCFPLLNSNKSSFKFQRCSNRASNSWNLRSNSVKSFSYEGKKGLKNYEDENLQNSEGVLSDSSAAAVAAAIQRVSTSPVEFEQRVDKDGSNGLVLPSLDFQRLCLEQLDLFRQIVVPDAILSVYVRPAGSYIMDRLELRRVTLYPRDHINDRTNIVILVGNFIIPTGLRSAEVAISDLQAVVVPESNTLVFPMVKHPFVVGFLVAELPMKLEKYMHEQKGMDLPLRSSDNNLHTLSPDKSTFGIQVFEEPTKYFDPITNEQRSRAIMISRSLAMAYVMDQKSLLLQQSSWQNNVRMSDLIEQIRSPLFSLRSLSKMLSIHMNKTEVSYDIIEDILVQGDRIKDTLQQLQDAVYVTKANIVHYNEMALKKMHHSNYDAQDIIGSQLANISSRKRHGKMTGENLESLSLVSEPRDVEMPMPPPSLAALQGHNIRPCNVLDILSDLVEAARPLAQKQQRSLNFKEYSQPLLVAVEESALHRALSNLIEGSLLRTRVRGKVEIISVGALAGDALIIIDDDGPDMHYMTQMHSLTPFGTDLFSEGKIEDNMTWNFVAGFTVAREILESYGCVVRVTSPRLPDATLGSGGTRIELWLPSSLPSDSSLPIQEI